MEPDATRLFDGDTGRRPPEVRAVITELLTERILHGARKPKSWQTLLDHEADIKSYLHDMYVDLTVNREREVAFKRQIRPDVEHRVLMRARTTTVEFAAGVLLLAEETRRAALRGDDKIVITRPAFTEAFETLWGTDVHNLVARNRNASAALASLCEEGLLIGAKDGDTWEVSPAVPVLYGPEEIQRILDVLTAPEPEDDEDNQSEDEAPADREDEL